MKLLRIILLPLVPIYYVVTFLRNVLYDFGLKKSTAFDFPVLCVGNLSVGGTGKTPMIEYLIRLLQKEHKVATLSRGYKRRSKGFLLADSNSKAETLGDEPFQFHSKFSPHIAVAVDANRVRGIKTLRQLAAPPQVVLLDDAFQHRRVRAGLNILLSTHTDLFLDDMLLPTGNLREPQSGASRADIIVITKCPKELPINEKTDIRQRLKLKSNQHLFFSFIQYDDMVYGANRAVPIAEMKDFTLVTGIANPAPLVQFLNLKSRTFEHLNFKDHHLFSARDIEILTQKKRLVTTEKDYMRLQQHTVLKDILYYLPIRSVIENRTEFDSIIKTFVASH